MRKDLFRQPFGLPPSPEGKASALPRQYVKQQFIVGMMLPDTTEKAMEPGFASSMALSLISLIQSAALLVALLVLVPILIAVGLLVVLLIFVLILVIHLDFLLNLVAVFPQR